MFNKTLIATYAVLILMMVFSPLAAWGQDDDLSKGVRGREYVTRRPKSPLFPESGGSPGRSARPAAPDRRYSLVGKKPKAPPKVRPARKVAMEVADIGLTLWRFEPAKDTDDEKAVRENDPQSGSAVIGRRITSDTELEIGDVVRIGIESGSHKGYLYVVNRERYADGTYGEPRLIFPNLSVVGGRRNFVQPGVLLYFPTPDSFFRVTSNTKRKQVSDELIVIVSQQPLVEADRLTKAYTVLPDVEVAGWLKKYGVAVSKLELDGGAGEPMTMAEKNAGDEATKETGGEQGKGLDLVPSLTQADALPQTLYRMKVRPGSPVIARIELKIKQN